jgi:hypothetical protein
MEFVFIVSERKEKVGSVEVTLRPEGVRFFNWIVLTEDTDPSIARWKLNDRIFVHIEREEVQEPNPAEEQLPLGVGRIHPAPIGGAAI